MRNFLYLIVLLFVSQLSISQSVITPLWSKTEISSNGQVEGWGIDVDGSGNVYWSVSSNELNQGLDIKCYKLDTNGNELWNDPFLYGGVGTQHAYVTNVNDTSVYIGGRFCTGLVGTCNMLLLKANSNDGTLVWDKTYNFMSNGYDEVDGLELKPDGIYCGGWAQQIQTGSFQSDIGLWKLDYSGNTIWTNHLGKATTAEHQDGHFVVDDNHIFAAGLWGGKGLANLYNGHAFLGKFSKEDGSLIDSTLFGDQSNNFLDIENALGMTSDGEFLYITGYATPSGINNWQIFVAKYDKNLNQLWYTDWGGTGTETARSIVVKNNTIYVAGLTESPELLSGEVSDGVLLQFDLDGNLNEYSTWGNEHKNAIQDLQVSNGLVFLTGTSEIGGTQKTKEAFLVVLKDPVTTGLYKLAPNISFQTFPNPATGEFVVKLDQPKFIGSTLTITNSAGKVINREVIEQKDTKVTLDSKGVYLINLDFGDYSVSKKIINH